MCRAQALSDRFAGQHLGSGYYGTVNQLTERVVIKTVRNDPGYLKWIKACANELRGNPHVPIVFAVCEYEDGSFTVIMERLTSYEFKYEFGVYNWDHVPMHARRPEFEHYRASDYQGGGDADEAALWWPECSEYWQTLWDFLSYNNANDMHPGNFMRRADGTCVITDPFSGQW
jgi:hypothetical protein